MFSLGLWVDLFRGTTFCWHWKSCSFDLCSFDLCSVLLVEKSVEKAGYGRLRLTVVWTHSVVFLRSYSRIKSQVCTSKSRLTQAKQKFDLLNLTEKVPTPASSRLNWVLDTFLSATSVWSLFVCVISLISIYTELRFHKIESSILPSQSPSDFQAVRMPFLFPIWPSYPLQT